jgi:signal peptidase I
MLPSYYGMTAETFTAENEPGLIGRVARLATFGANHHSVKAPADGEVLLPVLRDYRPAASEKSGRSMLIFPTNYHEFTLSVGGEMVRVTVPAEFDYEFYDVLRSSFFPGRKESLNELLVEAAKQAQPLESSLLTLQDGAQRGDARVYWIPVGKRVKRGETVLSFDVLSGDLLFVDRLSYNFVPPKVGSGFVFRTGGIEALKARAGDQYYVKRLVGTPGDVLEIKAPALYRNGKPIEGSAAFGRNARREGKYPGYTNVGLLPADGQLTVPEHVFFALGDNSPRSYDSRFWGFVPEKDVVGRPLFIYYPLTRRWGPAL